jgi:hypothetical protein
MSHNTGMKTSDVTIHYGTQTAAAKALGIDQSSISGWGEYPPDRRQVQIERLTLGALKAEPGCFERLIGMDKVANTAS